MCFVSREWYLFDACALFVLQLDSENTISNEDSQIVYSLPPDLICVASTVRKPSVRGTHDLCLAALWNKYKSDIKCCWSAHYGDYFCASPELLVRTIDAFEYSSAEFWSMFLKSLSYDYCVSWARLVPSVARNSDADFIDALYNNIWILPWNAILIPLSLRLVSCSIGNIYPCRL